MLRFKRETLDSMARELDSPESRGRRGREQRYVNLAVTKIQEAAMWIEKAELEAIHARVSERSIRAAMTQDDG